VKYFFAALTLSLTLPATAQTTQPENTLCERICSFADGAGDWSRIVTCTPRMDAKQCKASADNRNLSDVYPHKMKCEAKLVANCTERRE